MFVIDVKSNKRTKVSVEQVNIDQKKVFQNFDFEWGDEKNYEVYKLTVNFSGEVLGLMSLDRNFAEQRIEIRLLELSSINIGTTRKYTRIAGILIAFACKESFLSGFYGFVSLIPKTKLIDHYKSVYGFVPYGKHLVVELQSSEKLMHKYLSHD